MPCVIWYHLLNLKNVKNAHGGVILSVKLQPTTLQKVSPFYVTLLFSHFLNCTNVAKFHKASNIGLAQNFLLKI